MTMLNTRMVNGQCVIELPGHFDQNDWLGFRDQVNRQFIDSGVQHVIIDCEEAVELPSIAFGSLASLCRDFSRINGSLYLVHVSERNRMVMTRTRMDKLLPIHGTLTEVFRKSSAPRTGPVVARPGPMAADGDAAGRPGEGVSP